LRRILFGFLSVLLAMMIGSALVLLGSLGPAATAAADSPAAAAPEPLRAPMATDAQDPRFFTGVALADVGYADYAVGND
jgi:hypothetical protein